MSHIKDHMGTKEFSKLLLFSGFTGKIYLKAKFFSDLQFLFASHRLSFSFKYFSAVCPYE